jgi:hypothetical protein
MRGQAAILLYDIFGTSPPDETVDLLFELITDDDLGMSAGRALGSMKTQKNQILSRAAKMLTNTDSDDTLGLDRIFGAFGDDALKVLDSIPVQPDDYTLNSNLEEAKRWARAKGDIRKVYGKP